DLATLNPEFTVTVKNVKTFVDAPVCQETFDKIFGEGVVKSEDEFDAQIEERLKAEYAREADYRFQKDLKDYLVAKAGLEIPEKFLKRWIFVANDGKFTMEEIEKEWPMFVEDYKWQLIREWAMEKYSVKVEEADLMASAKGYAAYQFAMYGMNNVPDEQLESFAKSILSQEKESRRIVEQVENEKTLAAVREVVSMKKKSITVAKFRELA
ncbi:MAG: trigger factor, partial [Bacteroidales bacterium]|nr:trigger factor [Bacteroidales bacterium]